MALKSAHIKVGDTYREIAVENLRRTQIVQYAGAGGDYNPIHTDEIYATKVSKMPSVIAHGMLTMGITGTVVTKYAGDARLKTFGGRFAARVFPGDTLSVAITVTGLKRDGGEPLVELDVVTTNQDNAEVFRGYATALADE